jgi:hypothetical protein
MFNFGIRTDLIILADLITSTQKITKKPRETAQRGGRYTPLVQHVRSFVKTFEKMSHGDVPLRGPMK